MSWVDFSGSASSLTSSAGGGGRIAIFLTSNEVLVAASYKLDGGSLFGSTNDTRSSSCLLGGTGTLYAEFLDLFGVLKASVFSYNTVIKTSLPLAVLTDLPTLTRTLSLFNQVNLFTQSLVAPREEGCDENSAKCSTIGAVDSTIECRPLQTTSTRKNVPCRVEADIVSFTQSAFTASNVTNTTINCHVLQQTGDSLLAVFSPLLINASRTVSMRGTLVQYISTASSLVLSEVEDKKGNYSVTIFAGQNVTLHQVRINALFVHTRAFTLNQNGSILPAFGNMSLCCVFSIPANHSACNENSRLLDLPYIVNIKASVSLTMLSKAIVISPAVFFCSPHIVINGSGLVSTDGMGCPSNDGLGTAVRSSPLPQQLVGVSYGGGRAGYGGAGGNGYGTYNNGRTYGLNNNNISSGSGGGCAWFNDAICLASGGIGGGIIDMRAAKNIYLEGNISSNGQDGKNGGGGGGSGGSISLLVGTVMQGYGSILAHGGVGGDGDLAGGGGGGGVILLNTYEARTKNFKFGGSILALGGRAGYEVGSASEETPSSNIPASAGQAGLVILPSCLPGYGNNAQSGDICDKCLVGYYSYGGDGSCLPCDNRPAHAYYTNKGVTTSDCPYVCENGYSDLECYSQFQKFMYNVIGIGGFIGVCISFFTVLIVPLLYFRYRNMYDWDDNYYGRMIERSFNAAAVEGGDEVVDDDVHMEFGLQMKSSKPKANDRNPSLASIDTIRSNYTSNPLAMRLQQEISVIQDDQKLRSLLSNRQFSPDDLRREYRLTDPDMPFHAYRLNLYGCNEPFKSRGGAWHLSTKRPACLKPTLKKEEYRKFVLELNALLAWKVYSWDVIFYYLLLLIAPPLAAFIMRKLRHRRTKLFLQFIAYYDHACFRCPMQRKAKNSLRLNISPDSTLAYIDILFDENQFSRDCKPLCPIGQTKLPAAFRFAGLGTYSSPWYIDTNDLILQAVSQTDVAHAFIDETWITFIFKLNTLLRTVQCDAVYSGILMVMKFLQDENNVKDLGGIIVQLATFENDVSYDEDGGKEEESQARRGAKGIDDDDDDVQLTYNDDSNDTVLMEDKLRNRDTFIDGPSHFPHHQQQQQEKDDGQNALPQERKVPKTISSRTNTNKQGLKRFSGGQQRLRLTADRRDTADRFWSTNRRDSDLTTTVADNDRSFFLFASYFCLVESNHQHACSYW